MKPSKIESLTQEATGNSVDGTSNTGSRYTMTQDSFQTSYAEFSVVLCRDSETIATVGNTQTGQLHAFEALAPLIDFLLDQTRKSTQTQEGDDR